MSQILKTSLRKIKIADAKDVKRNKKFIVPAGFVGVTKNEIRRRLCASSCQKNLFSLLVFGKKHPKYDEWLRNVSYRFQYISSFVYKSKIKIGNDMFYYAAKLPEEDYAYWMFDQFSDFLCMELYVMQNESELFTQEKGEKVFEKYQALKRYILPMLQNTNKNMYPSYFRDVIEYVVEHDTYPVEDKTINYEHPNFPALTKPDCEYNFLDY